MPEGEASGLADVADLAAVAERRGSDAFHAYTECTAGGLSADAALARLLGLTADDDVAELSAFIRRSAALRSPEGSFDAFVECYNEAVDWRARTLAERAADADAEAPPSARASAARAPAASDGGGANMPALLALQSGIRGMLLRRRVIDALRFACWDRLDAWEELELLQARRPSSQYEK